MKIDFNIKREDAIYQEIEAYYDHEHSNGLSYQMAIRNAEIIKVLQKMQELYNVAEVEYHTVEKVPEVSNFTMYKALNYHNTDKMKTILNEYNNLVSYIEEYYYFHLTEDDLIAKKIFYC